MRERRRARDGGRGRVCVCVCVCVLVCAAFLCRQRVTGVSGQCTSCVAFLGCKPHGPGE